MKSLLHFLANRGIYKNGFFILPGPVEKKRDESPSPPGCKYLVPFPSPQNAPNPPLAFFGILCILLKALRKFPESPPSAGWAHRHQRYIPYLYSRTKNGGSILRMYPRHRQAQLFSIHCAEHHPRPSITPPRPACF